MIVKQGVLFDNFTTNVGRFTSIRHSGLSGAEFSPCGNYRYALWRIWSSQSPADNVMFIGLNPSTADATANDPTIRRCMAFAKKWGCGGMFMLNAYAYRSTDPKQLKDVEDPIGPGNDAAMRHYRQHAGKFVAVWGAHCDELRARFVCEFIDRPLECFGMNSKSRTPKHPLYLHSMRPLEPFWKPTHA